MSNSNPYTSPADVVEPSAMLRRRIRRTIGSCFGVGAMAVTLVYLGDAFQWPHFNNREGYLGTWFVQDWLYAINDPYAIHLVAILWFSYAAFGAAIVACLGQLFWRQVRRRDAPPMQ